MAMAMEVKKNLLWISYLTANSIQIHIKTQDLITLNLSFFAPLFLNEPLYY